MTRTLPFCALLALLATGAACPANRGGAAKADLTTEDSKTFYALGVSVGTNLGRSGALAGLQPAEIDAIKAGIGDALTNKTPLVDMPTYGPKIQQMMQARAAVAAQAETGKSVEEKKKGAAFEETAAKEAGAEKLASGLIFKSITPGTGASPTAADTVKVNYEGKLIDGTVFDASEKHGGAATFPLGHVIPCWTEGVQKLKVGGKAKLVCPSTIAYGDQGHPPTIPGGATLVFEVELLEVNPAGGAPATPSMPGHPGMGGMMPGHPGMGGAGAMGGPGSRPLTLQPGNRMMTPPPPAAKP